MTDIAMTRACTCLSGLSSAGFRAFDPSAEPVRAQREPVRDVHALPGIGAWGSTCHDDDLADGRPRGAARAPEPFPAAPDPGETVGDPLDSGGESDPDAAVRSAHERWASWRGSLCW